jgi:hypothetical protein
LLMQTTESIMADELEYAGIYFALRDRPEFAAKLLGCVRSLEAGVRYRRSFLRASAHEFLCTLLGERLSDDALKAAEAQGALLTEQEAIAEALAALP